MMPELVVPSPPVATAPPTSVALDGSASPASPSLFSPSLASPLVLGAALPAPSVGPLRARAGSGAASLPGS